VRSGLSILEAELGEQRFIAPLLGLTGVPRPRWRRSIKLSPTVRPYR